MDSKGKRREEGKEGKKRVQRGRRQWKSKCTCSTYVLDGGQMGRD